MNVISSSIFVCAAHCHCRVMMERGVWIARDRSRVKHGGWSCMSLCSAPAAQLPLRCFCDDVKGTATRAHTLSSSAEGAGDQGLPVITVRTASALVTARTPGRRMIGHSDHDQGFGVWRNLWRLEKVANGFFQASHFLHSSSSYVGCP